MDIIILPIVICVDDIPAGLGIETESVGMSLSPGLVPNPHSAEYGSVRIWQTLSLRVSHAIEACTKRSSWVRDRARLHASHWP
jgi:hypothetical protein